MKLAGDAASAMKPELKIHQEASDDE
jgi:hypothetical protein